MRGKKTDNETIYKIMLSVFDTNNYNESARILNLPQKTVEKIYKEHKNDKEFTKLCAQKKDEFIERATRIINKASNLLEKRIDTATEEEEELEELLENIYKADKKDLGEAEKKAIVSKIKKMQLNSLNEISTALRNSLR